MNKPIRTIVVGVGTVQQMDPVLPSAIGLARDVGARLHVVHAFDPPDSSAFAEGAALVNLGALYRSQQIEGVAAALEEQCARFAGPGQDVRVETLIGSAHHRVAGFAGEVKADLLMIGATRRGRILRRLLGTTAERVLNQSTVPVLVMHQPFFHPVERVLLTTDLSEFSEGIHESACDAVESLFGASVQEYRSLMVLDYHLPPPAPLPGASIETLGSGELQRFLRARRPRSHPIEGLVRVGEPPTEINLEADSWRADLIVMGTHGRSGIARYFFGSVAAATVRDATRNVLVVPPVRKVATAASTTAATQLEVQAPTSV